MTNFTELEREIKNWEQRLNELSTDGELANVKLQENLQKQQQLLQMISNISKVLYDTAQSITEKCG